MSDRPGYLSDDEHYAEQFPLTALDDHMIHQTPDPMRVSWTTDARAYERYWTTCQDDAGDFIMVMGGSFYPNMDTAEAYAIANYRGKHVSVRAFRRLGPDRMDLHVGPIKPEIVQGMRQWRYRMEDNEWGLTYDLNWYDSKRQVFREPAGTVTRGVPFGRKADVTTGFEGFGRVEGWVQIGDDRIELTRDHARGTRDRHWGVRAGAGGPSLHLGPPVSGGLSGNNFVEFNEFAIWGDRVFYNFGDKRPGMGRVVSTTRRLKFEPDTHVFLEGILEYTLDNGDVKEAHFKRIGYQTAYMRCGMYGGTPDKNIHPGMYVGDNVVEGDIHDASDPDVRKYLSGLDEHQCMVTCDGETVVGIFQPVDPDAFEACERGTPGWNFLE